MLRFLVVENNNFVLTLVSTFDRYVAVASAESIHTLKGALDGAGTRGRACGGDRGPTRLELSWTSDRQGCPLLSLPGVAHVWSKS